MERDVSDGCGVPGTTAALCAFTASAMRANTSVCSAATLRCPEAAERVLRWFVVAPDLHRVHHSVTERMKTGQGFAIQNRPV